MCCDSEQSHQIERLQISHHVVSLLQTDSFPLVSTQKVLSDLILIALNKNGQYVSALAPNYRKKCMSKKANH